MDATRTLPFSADDLFAGIRQAWNARAQDPAYRRLAFCLMGAALPSDLIRDPRITPFNVGRRIELRDFTPEEARPFANGLPPLGEGQGWGSPDETLSRVLHWTGGHPFLTQAICAALAPEMVPLEAATEASQDPSTHRASGRVAPRSGVEDRGEGVMTTAENAATRPSIPSFAPATSTPAPASPTPTSRTWAAASSAKATRASTPPPAPTPYSLYERMRRGKDVADDEANPAARIKMSGVDRVEGGNLRLRNRIYAALARDGPPANRRRPERRMARRRRHRLPHGLRSSGGSAGTRRLAPRGSPGL